MQHFTTVSLPGDAAYRYWKLYEDTYVIHYSDALDVFLLLGKTKALLIDTAYGRGDFPNIVEELKGDRELLIVNTHGHFDHTGGNRWFPKVHMHPNAMSYANHSFSPLDPKWLANMPYPDYEMIAVNDGYVFELGDRSVEVLWTPAHCDSSLSFIDHKRRLLFTGDELDAGQANLGEFHTVGKFLENCKRLKAREQDYDFIMPNHNGCPIANEYLDDFITAAQHIVEDVPDLVPFDHLPGYKSTHGGIRAQVGNSCINYLPEGMKRDWSKF
jgi:glyoxylase-like metal-dependent hydrolase (beta-lactamase superfamily II)